MPGKASMVVVTERQQDILKEFSRSTTIAWRLRQRAQMILLAFEKRLNRDIAETVRLGTDQVGKWRKRWQEDFDRLTVIEGAPHSGDLKHAIAERLSDEPRSGRPPTLTA